MESPPPEPTSPYQPAPARRTIIARLTQYQPKQAAASIVPYAPERLSISHDVLSPSMAQAFTHTVRMVACSNGCCLAFAHGVILLDGRASRASASSR